MNSLIHVPGSFRDPGNRVFFDDDRVIRGLDEKSFLNFQNLENAPFYGFLRDNQMVVETGLFHPKGSLAAAGSGSNWAAFLEHESIPFISYCYEWPFSMLRRAALVQLRILEKALEGGWTLKDATPYNVQWVGPKPKFIDIPSFEPMEKGEPWLGYRQFCSMFLIPLMIKAHLGIDHIPLLRSNLEGISPTEALKYFRGTALFKRGVVSHVVLPARVENRILATERDRAPAKHRVARPHSEAMVLGLIQSMIRLVKSLSIDIGHSDWSLYDQTHSYADADFEAKKAFVHNSAARFKHRYVWDIGCNTGTFSRICEPFADHVISVDGDHNAVERLYLFERQRSGSKILPLIMNLSNISPGQGWAGKERMAFDQREKPDLVLSLALIHHIRISANIPLDLFFDWLRSLGSKLVVEWVGRNDEMVKKLLMNKKENYPDYNFENFSRIVNDRYSVVSSQKLKNGDREIFYLEPR
jgi:SAM-dependent methyltransferase